ncbi:MAG: 1,4-alpha-glucan branching protein GlgB [Bryobacterales bacterium]|nr:1,4-alpha-glucan branching protein GlgB [Bryobacterales bacterium]
MNVAEMEAIAGGFHGDPFGILGPHRSGKRCEVRAFLPHASAAEVVAGGFATPMVRKHEAGFFVARLPALPDDYRIRLTFGDGGVVECDDPYRFPTLLSDFEIHLHAEGTHYEAYNTMGAHLTECLGVPGVRFSVWAPNAEAVSVIGDFNAWDERRHPMRRRDSGIWELFLPNLGEGTAYKYHVRSRYLGYRQQKADPYAFHCETPPASASLVRDISKYQWNDSEWLSTRASKNWLKEPVSIYEVHLASWLQRPGNHALSYRELADSLVSYAKGMGYTHIELLPMMEHPFSGSWGYQVIGYYAPTSRFGTPEDFMYFVDRCHQEGIAVLVDWVPAHFPKDAHGLAFFDGTALYEHEDPRKGEHRDWGTLIFNYGRSEVREFLISNALFWLKKYHIDGLRVDAVASMLYLDYSRKPGEWTPNRFGGNENLEAIEFLRKFNELAHREPGAITAAEESTAFPGVSRPVYAGGLGFTMKWNMGWMHDMLKYFALDPVHRKYHHQNLTFSLLYAFHENYVLPISHDEVVHLKGSLIGKMPGDEWRKFAGVRAFLAYMYGHPGKKLLFMGSEIGQHDEWNHDVSVRWDLLELAPHHKLQALAAELNRLYRAEPAMHQVDFHYSGFEWIDFNDMQSSVISFVRRAEDQQDFLLFCCNFTPVTRQNYGVGVPAAGRYKEILNTDEERWGGSGVVNGNVASRAVRCHGREQSIQVVLPPLAVAVFKLVP